jgi:hypothetical protein
MQNDVRINAKGLLTAVGAAIGVFLVLDLIGIAFGEMDSDRDTTFTTILVIGGYILSSVAFTDVHESKKATHYLTLPGSTLEKYVGRVLLTTVGWTLAAIALYMVTTLLSAGIGMVIFGRAGEIFLPVTPLTWEAIGSYIVTQSIFVFGAVYFKKHHFVKTVLAAVVIAIAFAFFSMVAMRIAFVGEFSGLIPTSAEMERLFGNVTTLAMRRFARTLEIIGRTVYWSVLPLYFWILGYRRMRETEV